MSSGDDLIAEVAEHWAATDRLWETPDTIEQSLRLFARLVLALAAQEAGEGDDPEHWTGLMAGFAPAETDYSTTNSGDVGGPIADEERS